MDYWSLLLAFSVSLVSVGLKGFQHQNITGRHFKPMVLTSYAMAFADVAMVTVIIKGGWVIAIPSGTGAALGMAISLYLHPKLVKVEK